MNFIKIYFATWVNRHGTPIINSFSTEKARSAYYEGLKKMSVQVSETWKTHEKEFQNSPEGMCLAIDYGVEMSTRILIDND